MKILPQIRAELARELVRQGLSQKETTEKLKLTPAAVSQYLSNKRGKGIDFPEELNIHISQLALSIKSKEIDDRELIKGVCRLCNEMRKTEEFMKVQKSICGFCP